MLLGGLIGNLTGANRNGRLKGTVVLMRKNVLDLNDFGATIIDGLSEFLGKGVTCQLISSTIVDQSKHLTLHRLTSLPLHFLFFSFVLAAMDSLGLCRLYFSVWAAMRGKDL